MALNAAYCWETIAPTPLNSPAPREPSSKFCLLSRHVTCYRAHFIFIASLIQLSLLCNPRAALHVSGLPLRRYTEMWISFTTTNTSSWGEGASEVWPALQSANVWKGANSTFSEFVWWIRIPLVFRTGGPHDRKIISCWMFYRRPLDSLLYFLPLSVSLCLQIPPTFVHLYTEGGEKERERENPVCPPPPHFFVIAKEQTHIKHTQGAEAVIAASTALLWVAGGDKISHSHIYIFFLFFFVKPELWSGRSGAFT